VGLPSAALDAPATSYVLCNDTWDMDGAAWRGSIGNLAGLDDNISVNPLFCDRSMGFYYLATNSPVAETNSTCGRMGAYGVACGIATAAPPVVSSRTMLLGAFPNPFNPRTEIRFVLERAQSPAISIYDAAGRLVKQFPLREYPAGAGSVSWNGQDDAGRRVASGIYFVQMAVEGRNFVQRVALVR
jgi:hypothetical protein